MNNNDSCRPNKRFIRITIFYLIALVFAYYFRFLSPQWYDNFHLPLGLSILKDWFSGLGPFVGAIIVIFIFNRKIDNTLLGTSVPQSIAIALVPLVLFTIVGAKNTSGIHSHLYGLWLGIWLMFYCILEEYGWRGYLQDELKDFNPFLRYLLIGLLWYAWHLTFLSGKFNPINELIILLILFTASIGIGEAVKHTKSVLVAANLHMIGNILAFSSLIKQSIALRVRIVILSISIFLWIFILIFWHKKLNIFENS